MIVTIDGMDAVGKTTVAKILKERLGASIIKGVRDVYVDKLACDSPNIDVRCLYYLASFLDSILDAKANTDSIIIFDKSFYSTIAYHRCLGSLIDIEKTITSIVCPDIKIFLTCPKKIWVKRLQARKEVDWYEEQIINQDYLSDKIESAYAEMGLIRIVNDNLENTVLEIIKLITLNKSNEQ